MENRNILEKQGYTSKTEISGKTGVS